MQVYFFPLVLAFSAIISASLAEDILSGALPFASLYYAIPYIPFMFIRFSFNDILLQLFQIIAG